MSYPIPTNENERLEALRQTGVLDTEPEESFDRLTDLAARICEAPIALITLVDVDRQWFKSHVGVEIAETPREVAFCAHAICQSEIFIVPDASEDERFAQNPLVTSDPKIRFYAGTPLITHDGNALGTFCVIDSTPRELDDEQVAALMALSLHATNLLEMRRVKALIASNSEAWEAATRTGDAASCTAALSRLGDNLKQMISAREESEVSIRDLERRMHEAAPQSVVSSAPQVDHLLQQIITASEHLSQNLGQDSQRLEAERLNATARRARELLGMEQARNRTPRLD